MWLSFIHFSQKIYMKIFLNFETLQNEFCHFNIINYCIELPMRNCLATKCRVLIKI